MRVCEAMACKACHACMTLTDMCCPRPLRRAVSCCAMLWRAVLCCRQSAVMGVASVGALRKLRAEAKAKAQHGTEQQASTASGGGNAAAPLPLVGPRPRHVQGAAFERHPQVGKWTLPFPGEAMSVLPDP